MRNRTRKALARDAREAAQAHKANARIAQFRATRRAR